MEEKRKYIKDWMRTYDNALNNVLKVELQIRERLKELLIKNPDMIIGLKADSQRTEIKASSLNNNSYLDTIPITAIMLYIEIIEKNLEENHPHQQQLLFN